MMTFFLSPLPHLRAATALMVCTLAGLAPASGAWAAPYTATHASNRGNNGPSVTFSAEQVTHGAQIYAGACAMCHGADLEGGHDVPDLGNYFMARWANTPLDRLAGYITHAMPLMAPGTLPPQDTAALVAFVLHHNGVTATSNTPLPMEEARQAKIRIPAPQALAAAPASKP
ncbi:c-type cytochrome [Acetobacter syzygii]|uniref:c-type cytochrome n=1 Tax=Acetobacter syzygii TaxID=146476 RepID=UPI0039ECB537